MSGRLVVVPAGALSPTSRAFGHGASYTLAEKVLFEHGA